MWVVIYFFFLNAYTNGDVSSKTATNTPRATNPTMIHPHNGTSEIELSTRLS